MKYILASASPRRRELLGELASEMGFEFEIVTAKVDETIDDAIPPIEGVRILAERKGEAVACLKEHHASLIISSDTLVELDGVALGKPRDFEEARSMLRSISARSHFVRTGIAVRLAGKVYSDVASTEVVFSPIPESEIDYYVSTGDPMDKAGAYGIQTYIGKFVKEYVGDYDTVVGLNLALTRKLIESAIRGNRCE